MPVETEAPVFPYARCSNCDEEFANRRDMSTHLSETFRTAPEGPEKRGHSARIVNPTPEEKQQRNVDYIVDDAVREACEALEREIDRGRLTKAQVADSLKRTHVYFDDAWKEYCEENDL